MVNLKTMIRPHLLNLETYHGVNTSEKMALDAGVDPAEVIRLNANENPYGSNDVIRQTLNNLQIHLYPDPLQHKLRNKLADYVNQPAGRIMAGAGGDEIIELLFRLFVKPSYYIVDCAPTFGMYGFCARVTDAKIRLVQRLNDWSIDIPAIKKILNPRTPIIFLASPNNPTGNTVSEEEVKDLLETGLIVVIDETYYEFCGETVSGLIEKYNNLVILRSFSKWAGIAGLRVGYCIASEEIIRHLMDIKQPYNINVAAEAAAIAAIENSDTLLETAKTLIGQRNRLEAAIDKFDHISYWPSKGNFLLCNFAEKKADTVYSQLARKGIFVRLFSDPRLQDCLRISAGTPEQTDRVIDALKIIELT